MGAQPPAMSGLVRQARGGAPMECLHVSLLDSADRAVAHTVTDPGGMFVLVAPATGAYRVQLALPGYQELEGPLVSLTAGQMTEQEYPTSFDDLISGELAPLPRHGRAPGVDLADWHSAELSDGSAKFGRRVPDGYVPPPGTTTIASARIAAQYIIDSTGRTRPSSWRQIAVTDPSMQQRLRTMMMGRRYKPARIGDRPVCQLVMSEIHIERQRSDPLH